MRFYPNFKLSNFLGSVQKPGLFVMRVCYVHDAREMRRAAYFLSISQEMTSERLWTRTTFIPSSTSGKRPFAGTIASTMPRRRASLRRWSSRDTLRTSPDRPSSPTAMVWRPSGIHRWLLAMARASARSDDASDTLIPPAMLANTSEAPILTPPNFSSKARIIVRRLGSIPAATR